MGELIDLRYYFELRQEIERELTGYQLAVARNEAWNFYLDLAKDFEEIGFARKNSKKGSSVLGSKKETFSPSEPNA